jgi:hypothetical protein
MGEDDARPFWELAQKPQTSRLLSLILFTQNPTKVNGRPFFMAIANGSFGLAVLGHS